MNVEKKRIGLVVGVAFVNTTKLYYTQVVYDTFKNLHVLAKLGLWWKNIFVVLSILKLFFSQDKIFHRKHLWHFMVDLINITDKVGYPRHLLNPSDIFRSRRIPIPRKYQVKWDLMFRRCLLTAFLKRKSVHSQE